eukprot:6182265-Pleurochrysis_carterae.AAC.2
MTGIGAQGMGSAQFEVQAAGRCASASSAQRGAGSVEAGTGEACAGRADAASAPAPQQQPADTGSGEARARRVLLRATGLSKPQKQARAKRIIGRECMGNYGDPC